MTARPWWEGPPAAPWWQPPAPSSAPSSAPEPIAASAALIGSDAHADAAESYLRALLSRLGKPVIPPR